VRIFTTDRIRSLYANAFAWDMGDREERPDLRHLRDEQYAEFDAWLAARDREVQAKAYDEAVAMCCEFLGVPNVNWPNPYRETVHVPVTAEATQ